MEQDNLPMFGLSEVVMNDLRGVFRQCPFVEEVWIFGSRAKGNYRTGSDIDLAVRGKDLSRDDMYELWAKIEDLGLLYNVDLLNYNKYADKPIGEHVRRVGKLFYQKEGAASALLSHTL